VTANGSYRYLWTTAAALNNDTIRDPDAIITAPSWFNVLATDIYGCRKTDSLFVDMIDECFTDFVFVPNGFSPNRDGINDCFGVLYTPPMTEFKLVIFDRWGEKMFESNDVTQCWDGTYKGVDALMDGYSFVVGFRCYNGKFIMKKGIVTIVR
jgi:gliding motility-associated-like protein